MRNFILLYLSISLFFNSLMLPASARQGNADMLVEMRVLTVFNQDVPGLVEGQQTLDQNGLYPDSSPLPGNVSPSPGTSATAPETATPTPGTSATTPETATPTPELSTPAAETSTPLPATSTPAPDSSAPALPQDPANPYNNGEGIPARSGQDSDVAADPTNRLDTGITAGSANSLTGESSAEPLTGTQPSLRTITLSFAGDCTIGDDDKYAWNTFDSVYRKVNSPAYFFQGVRSAFLNDDFTFINLEGTFTTASKKAVKEYRFKGDPQYVEVLKEGGIEGVTLANNHSLDYLEQGLKDTQAVLDKAGIYWTSFEKSFMVDVKGLRIGFLGYKGWENESRSNKLLKEQIKSMREQGVQYIIASYHWGDQNSYVPNALQKRMAHFAIDNGADLVIGHHPHVLQGREEYKGKPILYSLGNFCFGGAPNPSDKDTVIYQVILGYDADAHKITGIEEKIIPARVSSESRRNDYKPVIVSGKEADRILEKFNKISKLIK